VFKKHTKDHTRGVYRLLILDGHRSHKTPEFDLFYTKHKIITLCIPPHSLYLLQPLNVSCFATLKRTYRRQIQQLIQDEVNHINKPDFFTAYNTARIEAMTLVIVRSSFAATGLVLFDPNRVFEKLNTQLQTSTPPPVLLLQQ